MIGGMKTTSWPLVLATVLGAAACSYPKKARTIQMADIGNADATRIYNFMRDSGGIQETTHDYLIDEATIETLAPGHACFGLTIRSTYAVDLHPSQWHVEVNGVTADVAQIQDRDEDSWTYTSTSMETTYERTTKHGTTRVERPVETERTAGYVVRYARACAALTARASSLEVEVELPQGQGMSDWGERFVWQLTGA
jgi:hypothetical protein